jgi:hypothetical protein
MSAVMIQCAASTEEKTEEEVLTQIDGRTHSLIPNYNNDKCFSCQNVYYDVDFLSCATYQVNTIKVSTEFETGPEALCETTREDIDTCTAYVEPEVYIKVGELFNNYLDLYDALNKVNDDTRFVQGFNGEYVRLIDFLDGQLQDYWSWSSVNCYY